MNIFYPRLTLRQFGWMFLFGLVGAVISGAYGILHDQVTYRIGPEYFTKFKIIQFYYLDQRAPMEWTVTKIGFLATWWVGFFAGWFMGRVTIPHEPLGKAARRSALGAVLMLAISALFAAIAFRLAPASPEDARLQNWSPMLADYDITDALGFIRAGYIHNASYLGGLTGLITVLVWLRLTRPGKSQVPVPTATAEQG